MFKLPHRPRSTSDWPYTEQEMQQAMAAVQREGYPPTGRTGIGAAIRQVPA